MASIEVKVGDDTYEVDLHPDSMNLAEHERLQRQIGTPRWDRFFTTGAIELHPDFLTAYLYAKLATNVPDLEPDNLDVDFVPLIEALNALAEEAEGKARESA